MQDMTKLIKTIKNTIKKYETDFNNKNNNSSNKYKDLLENLKSNTNNLANVDMELIDEVLSSSNLSTEEIIKLKNNISTYKKLLLLNKNGKTNYKLSDTQIKDIKILISIIEQLLDSSKTFDISLKEDRINYLKSLLEKLEDKNNTSLITDFEKLEDICRECQIDIESKKEILYTILSYNQAIFVNDLRNNYSKSDDKLNKEEVKKLFIEFDYNIEDIKEIYLNELLEYATINNMRDVFETLRNLSIPKFDLKKDSKKLCSLLISSNRRTIEEIVDYSNRKGINLEDLMYIIPALIPQNNKRNNEIDKDTCIVSGRCEDYKKNIEFLESIGFDIKYVYATSKILLTKPHASLISNYYDLQEYGIVVTSSHGGELVHPTLTYLILNDFFKTLDSSIEDNNDKVELDSTHILKDKDIKNQVTFNEAVENAKDEVLYNKTIGNNELSSLDTYIDSNNPIRYNFDGILISRPKVNRIYNILINKKLDNLEDSLLYAVTYNSLLTEEQFNKIKSMIKGWNK